MFSGSADLYDLIYSTFKDYAAETHRIATLLRRIHPRCRTVLDVGCGTGEHARLLAQRGFAVDGLDLDPAMLAIARQKHPVGRFFEADMSDFRLPHAYDAVLCLFSSIGYLRTLDRVIRAFTCFRSHLTAGGLVIVEPWFAPGALDPKRVTRNSAEADGLRVIRVGRLEVEGRVSRLHFDYEIDDASGVRHTSEVHELGLFTTDELMDAFGRAGLEATYDSQGLTERGLYVARTGRAE
jgi:SAM-dependent methyltransferase